MRRNRILLDPTAGGGGGGEVSWHASLPEALRAEPSLAQIKGKDFAEAVPVLAQNYVSAQRMIGADKILKPQKHWGEKEWGEFYGAVGRPEKPDGYKFSEFKLEEGLVLDDAKLAKAREHFHKLGFTPAQADGVLQYYVGSLNEATKSEREGSAQSRTAAEAKLKQELGGDEQYRVAVDMANSVVTRFGDEELIGFLKATPAIANHPSMVKFLHKVAGLLSEDKARGPGGGPALVSGQTQATGEINRLVTDKDFMAALNDRRNPGHKDALERWTHLHTVAYPGKQVD